MPKFSDAGHRPHAIHKGEVPHLAISYGPESLDVELMSWGPKDALSLIRMLHANWGEHPMTKLEPIERKPLENDPLLTACFEGRTLQQVLEGISFWFKIDGVSRACTHQIVRTRQAGFMQHGGRDNDWRHRGWTMPETIRRVCNWVWKGPFRENNGYAALECVTKGKEQLVYDLLYEMGFNHMEDPLTSLIVDYLRRGKQIYSVLVDAGVPWQDARRLLPMGTQTYIFAQYNYLSLKGFLANRLEPVMDWEINCVAQLMLRQVRMSCPEIMWTHLGSHSDQAHHDQFSGLSSWPPSGKWPVDDEDIDRPRTHDCTQNPFWVLTDAAMAGGPIDWIATNGQWPKSQQK